MFDLIQHAIPVFVLCLALEAASFYLLPDDDQLGYDLRDSRTSLAMGLGNVVINIGWKLSPSPCTRRRTWSRRCSCRPTTR